MTIVENKRGVSRRRILQLTGAGVVLAAAGVAGAVVEQLASQKTTGALASNTSVNESPTPTSVIESVLVAKNVEKLGTGSLVPDSVWPGGVVEAGATGITQGEAITVSEIYNGHTDNPSAKDGNQQKLHAARVYAENPHNLEVAVEGQIDKNSLQPITNNDSSILLDGINLSKTSDTVYTAQSTDKTLSFKMFEVRTPGVVAFNQIAVKDVDPTVAYVHNHSTLRNELLYVVEVTKNNGTVKTFIIRGACGNIGSLTHVLPQPTSEFKPNTPNQPTPTPVPTQPNYPSPAPTNSGRMELPTATQGQAPTHVPPTVQSTQIPVS